MVHGTNRNRVGRISVTGNIIEFPLPTAGAVPTGITVGPDGAMWFTEFFGNNLGRITVPALLGDINVDGIVDIRDYGVWRQHSAPRFVVMRRILTATASWTSRTTASGARTLAWADR